MGLREVGIQLVARGEAAFAAAVSASEKAIARFGNAGEEVSRDLGKMSRSVALAATATEILDKVMGTAGRAADKLADQLADANRELGQLSRNALTATGGLAAFASAASVGSLSKTAGSLGAVTSGLLGVSSASAAAASKLALIGAAVGGVGVLGGAAGASAIAASMLAVQGAAVAATGAVLGFGVVFNVLDEAEPIKKNLDETAKSLQNLKEKGVTGGWEFDQLTGKLNDLQAEYDATFSGMIATTAKFGREASKEISKPIFDGLKVGLSGVVDLIKSPAVQDAIPRLAWVTETAVNSMIASFKNVLPAVNWGDVITNKVNAIVDGLGNFTTGFAKALPQLMAWGKAIGVLGVALGGPVKIGMAVFAKSLADINATGAGFQAGVGRLANIFEFLGRVMAVSSKIVSSLVAGFVQGLGPSLERMDTSFDGVIKRAGGFDKLLENIGKTVGGVGKSIGGFIGAVVELGVTVVSQLNKIGAFSTIDKIFDRARDAILTFASALSGNWVDAGAEQIRGLDRVFGNVGLGIRTVIQGIGEFANAWGPTIGKIAEVIGAISPLRTVLEVLGGFLSGGLGGGITAFEDAIKRIGAVFGVDLTGAISGFNSFVQGQLIPTFVSIGQYIQTNVLPAVQAFGNWISTNLGPILSSIGQTFQTVILPALQRFGEFIVSEVIPKLGMLGDWIGKNVVPVLEKLAAFIANTVVPVLGQIGAFILDTVVPAAMKFAEVIGTFLQPVLEQLGSFITSFVIPALGKIGEFISTSVIPALTKIWQFVDANIMPILTVLANFLGNGLAFAFQSIGTVASLAWTGISAVVSATWSEMQTVWNALTGFFDSTLKPAFTILQAVVGVVWDAITKAVSDAWTNLSITWNVITSFLGGVFKTAWEALQTVVETVWTAITKAIDTAWSGIKTVFDTIGKGFEALGQIFETVKTRIVEIWNSIVNTIKSGTEVIGALASGDFAKAFQLMQGSAEKTSVGTSAAFATLASKVTTSTDIATTKIGELPIKGGQAVDSLKSKMSGTDLNADGNRIGSSLMLGMEAGITGLIDRVAGSARSAASQVTAAARVQFDTRSPSKVFAYIGQMLMEGLALGIEDNTDKPVGAMDDAGKLVGDSAVKALTEQADLLTKIASATGALLNSLSGMKGFGTVGRESIAAFNKDVLDLTAGYYNSSTFFSEEMLKATSLFAETTGKVGSGASAAFSILKDLSEYAVVGEQSIFAFGQDLFSLTANVYNVSKYFSEEMMKALSGFADTTGKLFTGLKDSISIFDSLRAYTSVPSQAMQAFSTDIELTVKMAGDLATKTGTDLLLKVAAFGEAVGKLFTGLKAPMDIFLGMRSEGFEKQPSMTMQAFIDEIGLTVKMAGDMATKTDTELLGKASEFSTAVDKIFSKLKSALDIFKSLEGLKDNPAGALGKILEGIGVAIEKMAGLNSQATIYEAGAQTFADTMQKANQLIADGLAGAGMPAGAASGGAAPALPGMASGGTTNAAGLFRVGEQGPEIVWLPKGATVLDALTSARVMGDQSKGFAPMTTPPASASQIYNQQQYNNQQASQIVYDQRQHNFTQTNHNITPNAAQDYYTERVMAGF